MPQANANPLTTDFGQYSLISYIHQLRCERVNLGVVVWHPVLGFDLRIAKNLQRVRCIDEGADMDRVRAALERVRETVSHWSRVDQSPLACLAEEFRYNLVVTPPLNARVCSPSCTLERLYTSLIAPEPFIRASSTRYFSLAFAARLKTALREQGVGDVQTDFFEEETFQPVRVTALYRRGKTRYMWRAFSFATYKRLDQQLLAAKAIYAENADLKSLPKYRDSSLAVAVQMPKPDARADWPRASEWLHRGTERVELFEDKRSLEEKIPELVAIP
jgi:hypothetical protein